MSTLREAAVRAVEALAMATHGTSEHMGEIEGAHDALRAALSAAPAPQPAGGERERYEFVLAQCREAQDIAASRGWALNAIATASTTDPKARKIATEALLGAPQVQRAGLSEAEKRQMWLAATIELCSHENCYRRGIADAERHHGISPAGADK